MPTVSWGQTNDKTETDAFCEKNPSSSSCIQRQLNPAFASKRAAKYVAEDYKKVAGIFKAQYEEAIKTKAKADAFCKKSENRQSSYCVQRAINPYQAAKSACNLAPEMCEIVAGLLVSCAKKPGASCAAHAGAATAELMVEMVKSNLDLIKNYDGLLLNAQAEAEAAKAKTEAEAKIVANIKAMIESQANADAEAIAKAKAETEAENGRSYQSRSGSKDGAKTSTSKEESESRSIVIDAGGPTRGLR